MARHAIAPADKLARREAILAAAASLFNAGDGSLPGAAQIAAAAGLAKGTVYLYFRTKEEIFIALLSDGLHRLLSDIATTFGGARGRRADKVAAFLTTYVVHLDRHPELLRLDAIGYGVLEANLDPGRKREFKLAFLAKLTETAALVEEALRLSPGRGIPLLMRTFALTRGLWQSHPHEQPRPEPALSQLYPNFDRELTEALIEYWRGAVGGA